MPTGYTSGVAEGKVVTFAEFATECARAFGALIEMRDEPLGAQIPEEFFPSEYHVEELKKSQRDLAQFEKWSEGRSEKEAAKAYVREMNEYWDHLKKKDKTGEAYAGMIKKVGKWTPPTKDHEGLKSFMIEQLAESIDFDCFCSSKPPVRLSGKQYRRKLIKNARWSIAYHTKENKAEISRTAKRNKWVRELRESLKK